MSHISWMEVFETNQILNAMIMVNQKNIEYVLSAYASQWLMLLM